MQIVTLLLVAGFALLRVIAAKLEKGGRMLYRESGDVLSLRNNLFWRLLKGFSGWGLVLASAVFLQITLRPYF